MDSRIDADPPQGRGPIQDADETEEIEADAHRGTMRQAWAGQSAGRRRFIAAGVVLTLLGMATAVWFGLSATVTKPNWRDLSFNVVDDRLVQMRFELTKPKDMTVQCTVIAQEVNHGVVGRTVLTIGPTEQASTVHDAQIKTTTLAVIGTVRACAEWDPATGR